MLTYEPMKAFADLLAADQAPDESGANAFNSKRYIYSIQFDNNLDGQVEIRVHCQWEVLKEYMRNHPCAFNWHVSANEAVHINAIDKAHPELSFVAVVLAWELRAQTDNSDRTLKELFEEWLEKQEVNEHGSES